MNLEYKPGYTLLNPDFNDTLYPTLEEKLNRKLTAKECERFFWTTGMYKEWFFNTLKECATPEEAEQLFLYGKNPPAILAKWAKLEADKPKSLWSMIWEKLKRKL